MFRPRIIRYFPGALLIILALFLYTALRQTSVMRPFSWVLNKAAAPAYAAGAAIRRIYDERRAGKKIDLAAISAENLFLKSQIARLQNVLAENDALKSELGFKEKRGHSSVLARVISESSDGIAHFLTVDRGLSDGVKIGQAATVGDGAMIGKVVKTRQNVSQILLVTDSSSRVIGMISGRSSSLGVIEGDRGAGMTMGLIPQSEVISAGDTVATSGTEDSVPRGIIIGRVALVENNEREPFQSARVEPLFEPHPMFVNIILSVEQ